MATLPFALPSTWSDQLEVSNSGDLSLATGTPVAVEFDTEVFERDPFGAGSWHDIGGDHPSRFTNPHAHDVLTDLFFGFRVTNATDPARGSLVVAFALNGGTTVGFTAFPLVFDQAGGSDADDWRAWAYLPAALIPSGEYVEVLLIQDSGATQALRGTGTEATSSVFKLRVVG